MVSVHTRGQTEERTKAIGGKANSMDWEFTVFKIKLKLHMDFGKMERELHGLMRNKRVKSHLQQKLKRRILL